MAAPFLTRVAEVLMHASDAGGSGAVSAWGAAPEATGVPPVPLAPPETWEAVLAGTPFAGQPLQGITLGQVLGLPDVRGYEFDVQITTAPVTDGSLSSCPPADAGSTIELAFQGSRVQGKVAPAWDPPLIADQDRVPRKGESIMKEFHALNLGAMKLEKGRGNLLQLFGDVAAPLGGCLHSAKALLMRLVHQGVEQAGLGCAHGRRHAGLHTFKIPAGGGERLMEAGQFAGNFPFVHRALGDVHSTASEDEHAPMDNPR